MENPQCVGDRVSLVKTATTKGPGNSWVTVSKTVAKIARILMGGPSLNSCNLRAPDSGPIGG
jgi:hypothetical protein